MLSTNHLPQMQVEQTMDQRLLKNQAVKLPFGVSVESSRLLHISEVPRGLDCKCVCPGCEDLLVAKKGPKTAHHFAHNRSAKCPRGLETAIHLFAKELIIAKGAILLPSLEIEYRGVKRVIFGEHWAKLDKVSSEFRLSNIIPDIFAAVGEQQILIEIVVSNPCDATKIKKIKEIGVSTVEVYLSKDLIFEPRAQVEKAILESAPRKWIFNQEGENARRKLISHVDGQGSRRKLLKQIKKQKNAKAGMTCGAQYVMR